MPADVATDDASSRSHLGHQTALSFTRPLRRPGVGPFIPPGRWRLVAQCCCKLVPAPSKCWIVAEAQAQLSSGENINAIVPALRAGGFGLVERSGLRSHRIDDSVGGKRSRRIAVARDPITPDAHGDEVAKLPELKMQTQVPPLPSNSYIKTPKLPASINHQVCT